MPNIIASTYEIEREIGSGGGGVVYLGRHLRLGKWIVLKADKRTLSTKPEVLRREVDALKNLSHTYIPQVYDFVAEKDAVYTVMDYIEGESLDKPLKRGERFRQDQVIEWACQLLEALIYLHSRPPYGILHGDLKPANVMLTPQGDIRLIDFNIALALGEEGAVQVGFSRGYASPEHYGIDYRLVAAAEKNTGETQASLTVETQLPGEGSCGSDGTSLPKPVRLDVRSDVYSLGATLYHLLSGIKPKQDAREVEPLTGDTISPAVAAIIEKAMQPNPDLRYQTAAEMLEAFKDLHKNDGRVKRHRRRKRVTAAALVALFLAGGGITFAGLKQMEQAQAMAALAAEEAERAERTSKEALAAVRSAEAAYQEGDVQAARVLALEALNTDNPYVAQGQKILTDALGVYDLSDGLKPHLTIELPSEALKLAVSDEGKYVAAFYAYRILVAEAHTGETVVDLPTQPTAVSDFCFFQGDKLLYAGEDGISAYDLANGQSLWTGEPITRLAVSEDETLAVGVDNQADHALVYRLADGQLHQTLSFRGRRQSLPAGGGALADPEDALLELNSDGSWLAVSFEDGGLSLYHVESGEEYKILDSSSYFHFEGGFYDHYFAFSAWNEEECVFTVYDLETMTQTGGFSASTPFFTRSDHGGIYVASENLLVRLDPVTGEQQELAYADSDIRGFTRGETGWSLLSLQDNTYALFNAHGQLIAQGQREKGCELIGLAGDYVMLASLETPTVQALRLESYPEAQVCSYDPQNEHIEARLSADGETVMLFQHDKFFLYSREGVMLTQTDIPNAEQVYDQQYRRDGSDSWLEVIYRDGRILAYSSVDGGILWERQGEAPDESLEEIFETEKWRIEAPLHEPPTVYDKMTGAFYRELEKDSYLTYVTEVGEYIVTQYLSAQGEWYGLLLDQELETLAYLPNLCDVMGDTLLFDDGLGNLRQSRIYSAQELKALVQK